MNLESQCGSSASRPQQKHFKLSNCVSHYQNIAKLLTYLCKYLRVEIQMDHPIRIKGRGIKSKIKTKQFFFKFIFIWTIINYYCYKFWLVFSFILIFLVASYPTSQYTAIQKQYELDTIKINLLVVIKKKQLKIKDERKWYTRLIMIMADNALFKIKINKQCI